MSDDFEMPSDDVLRESARREHNFWYHVMPVWLEGFTKSGSLDEKPFLPHIPPAVTYLVKDPKEPYRRSLSLEAMKGYEADPSTYPNTMPCIFRRPMRLNKVTIHLFPRQVIANPPIITTTPPGHRREDWL